MKSSGIKKVSSNGSRRKKSIAKKTASSRNKSKKVFPLLMIKQWQKRADSVARHPLAQSAIKWVKTSPSKITSMQNIALTKASSFLSMLRKQ